jgi:hypothetical protein
VVWLLVSKLLLCCWNHYRSLLGFIPSPTGEAARGNAETPTDGQTRFCTAAIVFGNNYLFGEYDPRRFLGQGKGVPAIGCNSLDGKRSQPLDLLRRDDCVCGTMAQPAPFPQTLL